MRSDQRGENKNGAKERTFAIVSRLKVEQLLLTKLMHYLQWERFVETSCVVNSLTMMFGRIKSLSKGFYGAVRSQWVMSTFETQSLPVWHLSDAQCPSPEQRKELAEGQVGEEKPYGKKTSTCRRDIQKGSSSQINAGTGLVDCLTVRIAGFDVFSSLRSLCLGQHKNVAIVTRTAITEQVQPRGIGMFSALKISPSMK